MSIKEKSHVDIGQKKDVKKLLQNLQQKKNLKKNTEVLIIHHVIING